MIKTPKALANFSALVGAQRQTPKVFANFSRIGWSAKRRRRWLISATLVGAQRQTPKALANFSPAVGAQRQPWV